MSQHNLSLTIVALIVVFLSMTEHPIAEAQTNPPPNIVYILADDLGYGDLSCYDQKEFSTPRIDSLARDGLKFTQHYAGSTVCAPSRCALMTGFHTGHAEIRGNKSTADGESNAPLSPQAVTVAKILQTKGYATGCFGKWGLGYHGNSGDPQKQGFDEFFGYYDQAQAHNYYPPFLYHNGGRIVLDRKTYSHDLIAEKGLEFIRKNKDKPFFCYMPVTIPHAAMQVPEEYVAPWRSKYERYEDEIAKYSSADPVRNPVAAFPGMMTKLDETVGRVIDLLRELGLEENTIIFFSSDNGPHKEGGHRSLEVFHSNGPLKGVKRDLTEGGIRVPMLAKWPAHIKAGTVTDHISAFWDVLPTVCELVGEQPPEKIDGISFLPTLLENTTEQKAHDYLYWEFHEGTGKRALRVGDWKVIQQANVKTNPDGPLELYNLKDDLAEINNLADKYPDQVKLYRELLKEARVASPDFPFLPSEKP
jgi:arylsulfatase A-like enzyme